MKLYTLLLVLLTSGHLHTMRVLGLIEIPRGEKNPAHLPLWKDKKTLHGTAFANDEEKVRELMKINPKACTFPDPDCDDQTPLHLAAAKAETHVVKAMLEAGAQSLHADRIPDKKGRLALHHAQYPSTARLLLSSDHSSQTLEHKTITGLTPFLYTISRGNYPVALTLAKLGANVQARDKENNTALHYAIRTNHRALIEFLLNSDPEDKKTKDLAHLDSVLIEHVKKLHTALHDKYEPHLGYPLLPYTLAPELVNIPDPLTGRTALHVVVNRTIYPNDDDFDKVLKHAITINARDRQRKTPLHEAKNGPIAETLILAGANVNARDERQRTPLHIALGAESYDHEKDSYFWHGFLRIKETDPTVATTLLSYDANPNAQDCDGRTPLHFTQKDNVRKFLLKTGAHLETQDNQGRTPLAYKAHYQLPADCYDLLTHGANPNARDHHGRTPLMITAARAYQFNLKKTLLLLQILLDYGADRSALDSLGNSALDHAFQAKTAVKKFLNNYTSVPKRYSPEELP